MAPFDKIIKTMEYDKVLARLASHASTDLGKQLSAALKPVGDFDEVKRRLGITDEAAKVIRLKGNPPFGGIRNVRDSVHRARIAGMLHPAELLDIANTLTGGRKVKQHLQQVHEEDSIPALAAICEGITDHRPVEQAVRSCISDDAEVLDQASPELARIRREIRTGESRIRERLETMIRSAAIQKMLQEAIVTLRNDRYVIPVKQEYRSQFGGIVHDQSASGATLFIEPEAIVAMNNRLRELRLQEQKEIEKILRRLTELIGGIAEPLLQNLECLAELDFAFAKAQLAFEMRASLPRMNDRGFIKLLRARHPLIPSEQVVPTNIELGNSYTAIIITGPNTGGKTVTLKTVGLLSLMAMSGLFIPADDGSQLCVFDGIYADIGDEQSIEQNLSTFSSHMTNIISILNEMTPKSLLLLDELGAGTDPAEGSALAIALLETIHGMGCRIIATTHYSELKAYAYQRKGIINASMEFDIQSLRPTYRLLIGVPGRSNAFAIAERLGLPRHIIDRARGEIGEEDQKVDSMIASLEANRLGAEAERAAAEQLRRETESLRAELAKQQRRFAEQKDKLLAQAEREARAIVDRARKEADAIIAELRKLALEERMSIKEHKLIEAKRRLEEAVPEFKREKPAAAAPRSGRGGAEPIEPGDEVHVPKLNQKGHVVEMSGKEEAIVQIGVMKMKLPLADLERMPERKPKMQQAGAALKRTRDENVRLELDLRGMTLDEALIETDRFLDEAILANLGQVSIIHGKGTGVLRSGIQEFLRKHKHVKAQRMGGMGEGGSGVTVVELR
jgi:DNA mismatch repair protein MutS2